MTRIKNNRLVELSLNLNSVTYYMFDLAGSASLLSNRDNFIYFMEIRFCGY